jgi:hypothetical protein
MSCFDRAWYRRITNTGYKSDDLFSHIEYFANLCAAPVSNKKITFLLGCPSDKEKGHSDSWNGISCNDFNSYIYVSSINGKYFNHPIGYDSLRCWSEGYWVQLDKQKYKNKKINGYKKNGFIWQKWGCVKEESVLDKVRRVL